jgi:hypothetical protein
MRHRERVVAAGGIAASGPVEPLESRTRPLRVAARPAPGAGARAAPPDGSAPASVGCRHRREARSRSAGVGRYRHTASLGTARSGVDLGCGAACVTAVTERRRRDTSSGACHDVFASWRSHARSWIGLAASGGGTRRRRRSMRDRAASRPTRKTSSLQIGLACEASTSRTRSASPGIDRGSAPERPWSAAGASRVPRTIMHVMSSSDLRE